MNSLKISTFTLILTSVVAFTAASCQTKTDSGKSKLTNTNHVFSDQEKAELKVIIAKLFKDPEICSIPSVSYHRYLTYKVKRLEISERFNSATSQSEQMRLSSELQRLDQDYLLMGKHFELVVATGLVHADRYFSTEEDYQKIKAVDSAAFEKWFTETNQLVQKFNQETDIKIKMTINAKILLLRENIKLRYLYLALQG